MNEITHEDVKNFGISKEEEQLGYQIIIKKLVPEMVKQYNELVRRHNSGLTVKYKGTTPREIIRKLVKVKREYDVVEYASRQDFTAIEFGIRKKRYPVRYPVREGDVSKPQLAVGYWQLDPPVYHRSSWMWYPAENYLFPRDDEQEDEYINEEVESFHITKKEEAKALEYILNHFSKDYTENLGKKLRKTRHKKDQSGDIIEYSAWVDGYWSGFLVKKIEDYDGIKLMVGRTYKDYGDPEVWFYISLGAPEPNKPWSALEETMSAEEIQRRSVSKLEEQRALDFLNKVVIPKAVEQYNREIKTNPHVKYSNYKPTNVADVSRRLRKIRVSKYSDRDTKSMVVGSDVIELESKIPIGHIFGFFIDKANGELYASYESPFDITKHAFRVGANYF